MSGVDASYAGSQGGDRVGDLPGLRRDLHDRGQRGLRAAQADCPVDTGLLLSSIHTEDGQDTTGPYVDIVAGIPGRTTYLGYILDGTEPHTIRPRYRRALRFVNRSGQIVFAMKVNHPGTRPRNFLRSALDAAS